MKYYPRIFGDGIPEYSIDREDNEPNAIERVLHYLERSQFVENSEGKMSIIRAMYETILFNKQTLIVRSFRKDIIDGNTVFVQRILSNKRIHPTDKEGFIKLLTAVSRLCLSMET